MKTYDYSGLLKAIGDIKTEQKKAINEKLFYKKQTLIDLENKIVSSGMLNDWVGLKRTCRQVGVRLCPYGGYNENVQGILMQYHDYYEDAGMFTKVISSGSHWCDRFGFIFKDGQLIWKWWSMTKPFVNEFTNEEEEVSTKIDILNIFLKTYEKYREIQLQRVFNAMGKLSEKTKQIREEI